MRVSNRLARRAAGCLYGSGSVRCRGVLTGACLAAGLRTAVHGAEVQAGQESPAGRREESAQSCHRPSPRNARRGPAARVQDGGCPASDAAVGRKQSAKKPVAQDSWHSLHSVCHARRVKDICKGYQGCLQRGCFDLSCPRGNKCPKSQAQLRKAAQNQRA